MQRTVGLALLLLLASPLMGCSDFILDGEVHRRMPNHQSDGTVILIDSSAPPSDAGLPALDKGTAASADTTAPRADTTAPRADTMAPRADTTAPRADTTAPPPSGSCGDAFESEVFRLVNIERAKEGLKPLACALDAGAVARAYSKTMCEGRFFSHTGLDGSSFYSRLQAAGVSFRGGGENIAAGSTTPAKVMVNWMHSPGHRANILRPQYTHLGVGFWRCPGGRYPTYWTQDFLVR